MDKRIAGLLGAAAALTTMHTAAQAAPSPASEPAPAASYRDLLDPIPNALTVLKAEDARMAGSAAEQSPLELAQYFYHHHHHHHHHHRYFRVVPRPYVRLYHHHHHHHHHHGFGIYIR